jgi:hypothetical protein
MKPALFAEKFHNRQEIVMLILTSWQAFVMGAFISLFTIGAHVLYFQTWDASRLPLAFLLSGILGIVLFSAYAFLVNRLHLKYFGVIAQAMIFVLVFGVYEFYDTLANLHIFGIPLFLPFSLALPLIMMTALLHRRHLNLIFTPRQHRSFYPYIRTSFMAGIVVASYCLVGALFFDFDVVRIIEAGAVCSGIVALLQVIINRYHRSTGIFSRSLKKHVQLRSRFHEMFYSKYTLLLLGFVLVSAVTGFLLHYHFISGTRLNYPNTIGLAKFFGFFTGTTFLFVYAVERFLVRKILYSYDSPYSLVLIPSLLFLAGIATLIVDLVVGQSPAFARFSFGFLMIAMLKVGYETTFEAIELPSLRVLFHTLDVRFSGAVITRMEGTLRMAGLLVSGLLIFALSELSLNRGFIINLILLLLLGGWIVLGIFLVKTYQTNLREMIRRLKTSKRSIGQELLNIDEKSHSLINSPNPLKSIHALSVIERLEPLTHEKYLLSLLAVESPELRQHLLARISDHALLSSLDRLKDLAKWGNGKSTNGLLPKIINRFEIKFEAGKTRAAIENLVNSNTLTDRILAAEIIGGSDKREWGEYLLQLSRDIEPEVKFASVKAMARLANINHCHVLIGYLTASHYYPYAFEALVKIGDGALPLLEQEFLQPDADNVLLSRIVRIYGKIGSPAAIECLLGKIENQYRTIARQSILALREAKFQATPANINRILNDIVRLITIMSWNFAAYASVQNASSFTPLKNTLQQEINDNYFMLYHLLALAYNPTSIGNIKNMLTEGNDTDISFAIELLDQIVNEEIKQIFFPVMENISFKDRFKQLQYFFHAAKENPENLIPEIITRDFNQISLYAKASAIMSALQLTQNFPVQEITASIFHPNQLVRESAAYVLHIMDPDKLESVYPRLDPLHTAGIKTALSCHDKDVPYLLLDRINFIKNSPKMQNISHDVLYELAKSLEIHFLNADIEFLIKREDVHYAFMIIMDGQAQINNSSGKVFTFAKNDIIYSDIYVEDNTFSLKALTNLRFYGLEQEVLNSLLFDHIDFRNAVYEMIEEA